MVEPSILLTLHLKDLNTMAHMFFYLSMPKDASRSRII